MFNWNIYCKYLEVSMSPYHLSGSKIFISQTPYNLWEGFGDSNFVIELFIIMIVFYPCFSGILYGINSGTLWLKIRLLFHLCVIMLANVKLKKVWIWTWMGKSLLEIQVLCEVDLMVKQMATKFVYQNCSLLHLATDSLLPTLTQYNTALFSKCCISAQM